MPQKIVSHRFAEISSTTFCVQRRFEFYILCFHLQGSFKQSRASTPTSPMFAKLFSAKYSEYSKVSSLVTQHRSVVFFQYFTLLFLYTCRTSRDWRTSAIQPPASSAAPDQPPGRAEPQQLRFQPHQLLKISLQVRQPSGRKDLSNSASSRISSSKQASKQGKIQQTSYQPHYLTDTSNKEKLTKFFDNFENCTTDIKPVQKYLSIY